MKKSSRFEEEGASVMTVTVNLYTALHDIFRPFLVQHKFKAIGPLSDQDERNRILCPVYRVQRKVCIHTLDVQYDRYREFFCVNIGVHFRFLPYTFKDELPTPHKTQTSMCIFSRRLSPNCGDHWWQVFASRDATRESVRDAVQLLERTGLSYFENYGTLPGPYDSITVSALDSKEYEKSIPETVLRPSPIAIASMMAYISKYCGKEQASAEFAHYALSKVDIRWRPHVERYLRFLRDPI